MKQVQLIAESKEETVKRQCPKCYQWNRITITEDGNGKESWYCHGCGKTKVYRI